ncbi:MAG: hypothetical protein ABIU10_03300 [Sphingomicrobium sp.]
MLFRLFALLALMLAPLASPAAAMAPMPANSAASAGCDNDAAKSARHQMPAGEHQPNAPCCTAGVVAIDPPLPTLSAVAPPPHMPFMAIAKSFALGAGPEAEDPPPRFA